MQFPLSYVIAAIGKLGYVFQREGFPRGAKTAWRASLTPPRHAKCAPRSRPAAATAHARPLPPGLRFIQACAQLSNAQGPNIAASLQFPPSSRSQRLQARCLAMPRDSVKSRAYSHVRTSRRFFRSSAFSSKPQAGRRKNATPGGGDICVAGRASGWLRGVEPHEAEVGLALADGHDLPVGL